MNYCHDLFKLAATKHSSPCPVLFIRFA